MIKRIIAAFMAAAVACGSAAVTAGAEKKTFTAKSYNGASVKSDKTDEDGCYYDGCRYSLGSTGEMYYFTGDIDDENDVSKRKELVIPSEIDGIPVTDIYSDAFCYLEELEKIYIPSSVGSMGLYTVWEDMYVSFSRCRDLTDVYFEGTEEQWYSIQRGWFNGLFETDIRWDGKFSKDSNFAYSGIENVTLHFNCESINDEGTAAGSTEAKPTKPAKVSGIKNPAPRPI